MPLYLVRVDVEVRADDGAEAERIAMQDITGDLEWSVADVEEIDDWEDAE